MKRITKLIGIMGLSLALSQGFFVTAFADGIENQGGIERDFVIDVNSKDSTNTKDNSFDINVNKKDTAKKDANKPTTVINVKDMLKPTKPSKARATITENVGADNKPYPVRDIISNGKESTDKGRSQGDGRLADRPKADKMQFVTFQTKNGKTFHLIINYDNNSENVQLLTEVSEQDLLNLIMDDAKAKGISLEESKLEKVVEKKEEPKKEEFKKEGGYSGVIFIGLGVLGVVGGAYYFKFVKPKKKSEDEIILEDEDDFFNPEEDDDLEDADKDTLKDEEDNKNE